MSFPYVVARKTSASISFLYLTDIYAGQYLSFMTFCQVLTGIFSPRVRMILSNSCDAPKMLLNIQGSDIEVSSFRHSFPPSHPSSDFQSKKKSHQVFRTSY
ncbi:hypothetical protein K435DRAFT_300633 [Dendrothele bispora CBS 962.96]|uniref:Uncharacterized protein n=1 Tax=Dendrothele bispora (strain CBS 962.96) TaxID=1314807 RepID=A0A4S8LJ56_DENBC|nr:hypothetical protein K435DRAFT_300633 [Dendrothele bispora CBS 962.96]